MTFASLLPELALGFLVGAVLASGLSGTAHAARVQHLGGAGDGPLVYVDSTRHVACYVYYRATSTLSCVALDSANRAAAGSR